MMPAFPPAPRGTCLIACGCLLLTLPGAAADDDVVTAPNADAAVEAGAGDEQQPDGPRPADRLFGKAGAVARHLRLDWEGKRLTIAGEQAPTLRTFVRKHEARIAAVVAKQAIEAAVKQGLSRQRAEAFFGAVAGGEDAPQEGQPQQRGIRFQQAFAAEAAVAGAGGDDDPASAEEDAAGASALQRGFAAARSAAFAAGGGGGSSSGGDGTTMTENFEAGATKGSIRFNQAREEMTLENTTRKLAVTRDGETGLTIRVETEGGDADTRDEMLRIRQTEAAFRAVVVRDGQTVGSAEGETFADACRASPAFVREQLLPALEAAGIVPPPLPDDPAAKVAVRAHLRAAAGRPAGAADEKPEPDAKDASAAERAAAAEWRQALRTFREKRLTVLIDAFRLTEDADYLRSLLDGAAAEDASIVRARLEKIAAGK